MIDVNLIGAPAFTVECLEDDFIYTGVNRRMAGLSGLPVEVMVGRSPHQCFPVEVADAVKARYQNCVASRQAVDSEAHYDVANGEFWWHITVTPVFGDNGVVSSLVGVAADISGRRAAERDQREGEARIALAMDVLDGGFWHLDIVSGDFEATPKLAALVMGHVVERMSWDEFTAGIHPADRPGIDLGPMLRGECETMTVEYRVPGPAGHGTRWFRSRRRLVRGDAGAPERIIGVVIDITEQRLLQETYERQATTDPLTGLGNRRGFDGGAKRFLEASHREQRRFGLIVLDLDCFKPINDSHGHAVGDLVLREVAARLMRQVRPDDVVARLGGDEFAILVADVEDGHLTCLAKRLVHAAQQPVRTKAGDLSVGVSVGATVSIDEDRDIGEIAARADRALYEVKMSGRGAWKIAA